jgi:hypothetical protein
MTPTKKKTKEMRASAVSWVLVLAALILGISFMSFIHGSNFEPPASLLLDQTGTPSSSQRPAEVSTASSKRTLTATDWPGIPVEELGHPLVKKGRTFVERSRELLIEQYLDEFLAVYRDRPDKVNLCGIRINHAYALFLSVKFFQPTTIIESGVNAGQSTYFMRAASPTARIYAIDPLDKPICGQEKRWIDGNTVYYTGDKFQDIGDIDWGSKIQAGEVDPDKTLVSPALCTSMLPEL